MLYTLPVIFENKIFRIPGYQRGYSWDKKQLEQLWNDLMNINYPFPANSFHFTGVLTLNRFDDYSMQNLVKEGFKLDEDNLTVVVNNKSYIPYHLVDGQQRTTTLLILVSILLDSIQSENQLPDGVENLCLECRNKFMYFEENENLHPFGYDVDVPSYRYFRRNIFNSEDDNSVVSTTLYTAKLDYAKSYFTEKLNQQNINDRIKLLKKITERLLFAQLILNENPEKSIDASMAFETLNFRGKELSNIELLKNRLMFLVSRTNHTEETKNDKKIILSNAWLEIYTWLGQQCEIQLNEDEFLKAFWIIMFSDQTESADYFKDWLKYIFDETFSLSVINNDYLNLNVPRGLEYWTGHLKKSIQLWYIIKNPFCTWSYFSDRLKIEFNFINQKKNEKKQVYRSTNY